MVFRGVGKPLSLETVPDPTPGPEEVVLKVGRCGICGTDLHFTEEGFLTCKEGSILGHEFAGEVVALGKDAGDRLKVGDLVTALPMIGCNRCAYCVAGTPHFCAEARTVGSSKRNGAYAEYVATGAPFTLKLPAGLSLEDGALIEPLAVGLRGVVRAGLKPGQKVLIIGAGPVGIAVAYWARRAGAGKVAVQASSNRREAIAREVGADIFVLPQEGVTPARAAMDALGGLADVVFECVGAEGMIDQALDAVAIRGVVVVLGVCSHVDHWRPLAGLRREVDIRFALDYNVDEFHVALDAMAAGHVAPRAMVTQTVSLDEMAEAFEGLRRRSNQCKVMVAP